MAGRIHLITFQQNCAVSTGYEIHEENPFGAAAYIKEVKIHWPSGCNALVDVGVCYGITKFCPRSGYLALDDTTQTFVFNELIAENEDVWVLLQNRDGTNTHQITVTASLEEKA